MKYKTGDEERIKFCNNIIYEEINSRKKFEKAKEEVHRAEKGFHEFYSEQVTSEQELEND